MIFRRGRIWTDSEFWLTLRIGGFHLRISCFLKEEKLKSKLHPVGWKFSVLSWKKKNSHDGALNRNLHRSVYPEGMFNPCTLYINSRTWFHEKSDTTENMRTYLGLSVWTKLRTFKRWFKTAAFQDNSKERLLLFFSSTCTKQKLILFGSTLESTGVAVSVRTKKIHSVWKIGHAGFFWNDERSLWNTTILQQNWWP